MSIKTANRSSSTCTRERLLKNRGSVCEICGYKGYVEVHHKLHVIEGGRDNSDNVVLVCEKCHADQHGWKKKNWLDSSRKSWLEKWGW